MRTPHVDDVIRLKTDIPELFLTRGEIGVVRSKLFSPLDALDVEFSSIGADHQTRAIVTPEQVELEHEVHTASHAATRPSTPAQRGI